MMNGWAHSCCSQESLHAALACGEIHSIESDIVLSSQSGEPVMAHPPATHSDLTFQEFLNVSITGIKKHLKLDFKESAVVGPCLRAVALKAPNPAEQTIFLNADIIHGPGTPCSSVLAHDADEFITQCQTLYPLGILSLGWKVDLSVEGIFYTEEHCAEMLALLRSHELDNQRVVLAVAARLLHRNPEAMLALIKDSLPFAELLVWTGTGEPPIPSCNIDTIQDAFSEVASHRVQFDVAIQPTT